MKCLKDRGDIHDCVTCGNKVERSKNLKPFMDGLTSHSLSLVCNGLSRDFYYGEAINFGGTHIYIICVLCAYLVGPFVSTYFLIRVFFFLLLI